MQKFTISNEKLGYISENDIEPNTMTIIDETATISTQKTKQIFSPKQSFPPKPYVEVPLPICLDMEEFMPKKSGGCKTSNAFIIYRTVFAKVLMRKDYQSKMTDVSKWAASSWKNEKDEIVTAYKKFAKEIQSTYKKRSQDSLINRNRRLIAPTTPRKDLAPTPIPPQINLPNQFQTYQPPNLIVEFPNFFPYNFPQDLNDLSSDKELQANDSIPPFNGFEQTSIPSTISSSVGERFSFEQDPSLNRDLEVPIAIDSYSMEPILTPPEIYFGIQSIYGNNDPGWVCEF
ncbi:hypothetical protein RclHR1_02210015 [Rhizophagus clarus]|uniref:HMG box domain-containing protein n=1 Tax=Rhizophagus clarus TaxID=94130 RepID=A0A2Z6QUM7_9GLOM|nr:hypothetical protein RclHR1_02210015 [Rhizophagus clarus]GET00194.1 hypothetical protein GLOIN_2v1525525 [Rhizophagus clarus]